MDKLLENTGKIFTTQNPDGSYSFIGNWFTYANLTLSTALFGFTFLIACILTAAYYVLVVVTEPSQQRSTRSTVSQNLSPLLQDWNFERVLHLIYFAYMTYTTLDLDDVTCQSKIICELQETDGIVGQTSRRVSKFLMFFEFLNTVPHIAEYKEAVMLGQRRSVNETDRDAASCDEFYSTCRFSVHRFNDQFNVVFRNQGTAFFN